jgi:hypothetical protein
MQWRRKEKREKMTGTPLSSQVGEQPTLTQTNKQKKHKRETREKNQYSSNAQHKSSSIKETNSGQCKRAKGINCESLER